MKSNLLPPFSLDLFVKMIPSLEPLGSVGTRQVPLFGKTQTSINGNPVVKVRELDLCNTVVPEHGLPHHNLDGSKVRLALMQVK